MNVPAIAVAYLLGPSVAVEVSSHDGVGDDALRGWLGARLLEEGYDLAPSARQAMATVRVTDAGTGLAVDAVGNGVRSFAVERGPSSVQRLEVLHRALQAVQAVTGQSATVEPDQPVSRPGLVVRLSGSVDESLMAELTNAARDGGVHLHTEPGPGDAL
ncbi:MAG: hypothetical protein JKY37_11300, partial [Nannocystaceae bacterium]|nr:hypothetical protein [Nannocystaceae bacterium]